jgi:peptidoglycan/LPS O-acetylase OafA/YrhL
VIACLGIYFEWYGSIAFGVIAAISRNQFGGWYRDRRAVLGLVSIIICTIAAFAASDKSYAFAAPFFSVSVVLLLTQPGVASPIGAFLGGVSYPFYLNSWLGGFAVNSLLSPLGLHNSWIAITLSFIASFAICAALYLVIDRQVMLNRGAWFNYRLGVAIMFLRILSRRTRHDRRVLAYALDPWGGATVKSP